MYGINKQEFASTPYLPKHGTSDTSELVNIDILKNKRASKASLQSRSKADLDLLQSVSLNAKTTLASANGTVTEQGTCI